MQLKCFSFFFFLLPVFSCAGEKDSTQALSSDTGYYKKYNDRFAVALYQTFYRSHELIFKQKLTGDSSGVSTLDYFADANEVTGVELAFDKFSFAFGFKSVPPTGASRKGKTYHTSFTGSLGGNKWFVEGGYRRFKGFYDAYTSRRNSAFTDSTNYYHNAILHEELKAKFWYFFKHNKFSYKSAYSCTYRQLKTKGSWAVQGNLYYNHLAADSSLIPYNLKYYYGPYGDLRVFNVLAFSAGGGYSVNFVLRKKLFLNITAIAGLEYQWKDYYHFYGIHTRARAISFTGDVRSSLGFNGKNFFMMFTSINDFSVFDNKKIQLVNKYLSQAFTIGYRFKVKTPKLYKRFQETKIYNML